MRLAAVPAAAAVALGLSACGSSSKSSTVAVGNESTTASSAAAASATTSATAPAGCRSVAAPTPRGTQNVPKPTLVLDPARTYVAKLQTNCGEIDIQLVVKQDRKSVV